MTPLDSGVTYDGSVAGNGQPQRFTVAVPTSGLPLTGTAAVAARALWGDVNGNGT